MKKIIFIISLILSTQILASDLEGNQTFTSDEEFANSMIGTKIRTRVIQLIKGKQQFFRFAHIFNDSVKIQCSLASTKGVYFPNDLYIMNSTEFTITDVSTYTMTYQTLHEGLHQGKSVDMIVSPDIGFKIHCLASEGFTDVRRENIINLLTKKFIIRENVK